MLDHLNGATRLFPIIGDPVRYAESPARLTSSFAALGHNAMCVPMQVPAAALNDVMRGLSATPNVDGVLVTMPHKRTATGHCATTSERSSVLEVVSVLRRNADGTSSWHHRVRRAAGPRDAADPAVGLIEEAAKLLVLVLLWNRHRVAADGPVIGVASGAGFALLETMGYAFVALIQSRGSIAAVDGVLVLRGFLSPAAHMAWTGLTATALWHAQSVAGVLVRSRC